MTEKILRKVVERWADGRDVHRRGDRCDSVATLQRLLSAFGFPVGGADGIWGGMTDETFTDAQRELSLAADGDLGPKSRARLDFAHSVDWMRGRYLPLHEGGPLAQGRHPVFGFVPSRRGKMSTFGGPDDVGDRGYGQALVRVLPPGSVQALYDQHPKLVELGLFNPDLTDPLPQTTMLGKKMQAGISFALEPGSYFCAMRWRRNDRPIPETARLVLEAANGRKCIVAPTDWGPARRTGRVIDISPGAKACLGIKTDDSVLIAWAEDNAPLGFVE